MMRILISIITQLLKMIIVIGAAISFLLALLPGKNITRKIINSPIPGVVQIKEDENETLSNMHVNRSDERFGICRNRY